MRAVHDWNPSFWLVGNVFRLFDLVHPNQPPYSRMASNWSKYITDLLPIARPFLSIADVNSSSSSFFHFFSSIFIFVNISTHLLNTNKLLSTRPTNHKINNKNTPMFMKHLNHALKQINFQHQLSTSTPKNNLKTTLTTFKWPQSFCNAEIFRYTIQPHQYPV